MINRRKDRAARRQEREREPKTYAQHLRIRRVINKLERLNGGRPELAARRGDPIPGVRTPATLARKARSRARRAARKQHEEAERQQQELVRQQREASHVS